MYKILIAVALVLLGVVIGYFLKGHQFFATSQQYNNVKVSTPSMPSSSSDQTVKNDTTVSENGQKTYISTADNIKVDYPNGWILNIKKNPFLPDKPDVEDFSFEKPSSDGGPTHFVLNMLLTVSGVGGGCPDFDPTKRVVYSEKMSILNKTTYLIFIGDKSKNIVNNAYISSDPSGICPNVAFVEIPGLPGLFAASFMYKSEQDDSIIEKNKDSLLNDPNVKSAEEIIKSLRFISK